MVLLAAPLSALLLACAHGDSGEGGSIIYRYPPDSLLVVGADASRPTLEQLTGPDGDRYTATYINALETVGLTRKQAIQCVAEWKRVQMAIDSGGTPGNTPAYCTFTEEDFEQREGSR